MRILGIETSCDETAASIVESVGSVSHVKLLSSVTATSLQLHAKTGGIIPEIAARNQLKDMLPVIKEALEKAGIEAKGKEDVPDIDAIAVTYGPGLVGSLLVGVETAKTLSYVWNKPLIPVNHLFGHLYANYIETPTKKFTPIPFPALGLIISGAHTDLVLFTSHTESIWLGGTRDDAAGEAFDKIGRMLGIAYPAGAEIEKRAKQGNPHAFSFPRPLMYDKQLDFSFSGLKTAVLRTVQSQKTLDEKLIADICRASQDAIIDVLVYKTLQAVKQTHAQSVILGGGVSANETLTATLSDTLAKHFPSVCLFYPEKSLSTDNAVMIASAAAFQNHPVSWEDVTADPELYFD